MMNIVPPKPFFYKGGKQAVLLLHSFTSNTMDMKKLGKYLQQHNYTCYAPLYKGHGLPAEELLTFGPSDWWEDVRQAYQLLKDEGYEKIAVIGTFSWWRVCLKSCSRIRGKWCCDNVRTKT